MTDEFQPGDRVRLNAAGRKVWPEFTAGVIIKKIDGDSGAGPRDNKGYAWGVRFDEYGADAYRSPDNCHIAAESVLEHEVSDEDVAAAIRSITGAA